MSPGDNLPPRDDMSPRMGITQGTDIRQSARLQKTKRGSQHVVNGDDITISSIPRSVRNPVGDIALAPMRTSDDDGPTTGLASEQEMRTYADKVWQLQHTWADLDIGGRTKAMSQAVNATLEKFGVPTVRVVSDNNNAMVGTSSSAGFTKNTWFIYLGSDLTGPDVTPQKLAGAANSVYHEARHAEQTFRVARKMAYEKKTADEISEILDIPPDVARDAVADPLIPGTSEEADDHWAEAVLWESNMLKMVPKPRSTDAVDGER